MNFENQIKTFLKNLKGIYMYFVCIKRTHAKYAHLCSPLKLEKKVLCFTRRDFLKKTQLETWNENDFFLWDELDSSSSCDYMIRKMLLQNKKT